MNGRWIELAWPDRLGRLRGATVPEHALDEAMSELRIDPEELGWPGLPGPLRPAPEPQGRRLPWAGGRELRMCFLVGPDGEPSPACGRSTLRRALERAGAGGFEVIAAAELELFLADANGDPVYSSIQNYGIVAGAAYEPLLKQVRAFEHAGVPVTATNPEYGGGQFEINLMHGPALAAADAVALLRAWTGALATQFGLSATFSAKPWADGSGSGMHLHQSLWQDGRNAFWDEAGQGLSPMGSAYLAGLLSGMAELAPLGSPTPLAYTRRSDGSFCPTSVCWGGDNRTVAARVLAEDAAATRIEQRDAAADASPYLTLAGQVTAGLQGIDDGLGAPPPVHGNAYARTDLPRLPRTLEEAVALFRTSRLGVAVLGDEAHSVLCDELDDLVERELAGVGPGPDPDGAW